MQMNLKTTIVAYPKLSPSMLTNYVQEAPIDDNTYARKNGQWVEIIPSDALIITGYSHFNVITADNQFKDNNAGYIFDLINYNQKYIKIDSPSSQVQIDIPEGDSGYCWFLSTVPLNSINDSSTGWVIDYRKQKNNITTQIDGKEVTLYCYVTDELSEYNWKFNLLLQGDDI